jgi:hypothetical protein
MELGKVVCVFCGELADGDACVYHLRNTATDTDRQTITLTGCVECRAYLVLVANAVETLTVPVLIEMVRVMREQPDVDPVEHIVSWQRERAAQKKREHLRPV